MAAQGVAKRATISIGFKVDQDAVNKFEHSLRQIDKDNTDLREAFDRTNSSLDRFNEHLEQLAGRNNEVMDRLRQADNQAIEEQRRLAEASRASMDTYKRSADGAIEANNRQRNSARQNADAQVNSNRRAAEGTVNMTREQREALDHSREAYRENAEAAQQMKDRVGNSLHGETRAAYQQAHAMGQYSREMQHGADMGGRFATANGRIGRSMAMSNRAIDQHAQAIRDAQGRDYRWLRTAQDMSGATLGLGMAFYKGAKEATNLQQTYTHAANMAHYGGERMSAVQHNLNTQYRMGTALSIKYGTSQQEIANGFQTMVARGYKTNEALSVQKSMLQASIASGDNYNDVVKNGTNIIDAFGLRTSNAAKMSENAKNAINQMAYAADQTATNFHDLGVGMSYVGATAHTAHQSIAETSTALGELSNNGMEASMAGTGLRKVLNSFLSINKKGQQAQVMSQLGLTEQDFKTPKGNLKSLSSLMTILNNKTKDMDHQQRAAIFHRFFGSTGQEAALNLAKDTRAMRKLEQQVAAAPKMGHGKGYIDLLSKKNMQTAQNQLRVFKAAWQAFTVTAARTLLPDLEKVLKIGDKILLSFTKWPAAGKKAAALGALAIAGIAPLAGTVFAAKSAFHALELTILHLRKMFGTPMPKAMSNSIQKQGLEDNASMKGVGKGAKGMSRGALLDSIAKHPTGVGLAGAGALALGMGLFMGKTANSESAKQVQQQANKTLGNPIQEKVKAAFDMASARQALEANGKFNKQVLNQNKAAYASMQKGLKNYSKQNANQSAKNLQTLRKYGAISKKQAAQQLKADQSADKKKFDTANNAIKALSRDEARSNKNGYMEQIRNQRKELNADKNHYKALQAQEQLATGKRRIALRRQLANILNDEKRHARDLTALDRKSTEQRKNDLDRAQKAIDRVIAGNGSKANKIYQQLARSRGRISTQTAAKLLRNAYKASHAEITSANKDYNAAKSAAWKKYNTVTKAAAEEYGTSSNEYKKIRASAAETRDSTIRNAETKRRMTVQAATEEHDKTIQEAESQCKGISSAVDVGTGHVITEWDKMATWLRHIGSDIVGICHWVGNALNSLTDGLAGKVAGALGAINKAAGAAGSFGKGHAAGGAIQQNELSLVNEKGRESAYNPTTNKFRLFPNNGPQVIPLYAGEHVLTAEDTSKLLTTGMGRGVVLPGYANGTDTLNNVRNDHRARRLHSYASGTSALTPQLSISAPDFSSYKTPLGKVGSFLSDWDPTGHFGFYNIPEDLKSAFSGHPIEGAISAIGDAAGSHIPHLNFASRFPSLARIGSHIADGADRLGKLFTPSGSLLGKGVDWLGNHMHHFAPSHLFKEGLKGIDEGKSKLSNLFSPGKDHQLLHDFGKFAPHVDDMAKKLLGKAASGLDSHLMQPVEKKMKQGERALGHFIGHSVPHNLGKWGREAGHWLGNMGHGIAKNAGKLWRGAKQKLANGARNLGHFFGHSVPHNLKKWGREATNGIKKIGHGIAKKAGQAWRGLKRGAGRAWRGMRSLGHRAMTGVRRLGRNIGRGVRRLGRNIGRGVKRFGRGIARTAGRTWRGLKRGAGRAWRGAKRIGRRIGNGVRRFGRGLMRRGRRFFRGARKGVNRGMRTAKRWGRNALRTGRRFTNRVRRMGRRAMRNAQRWGKRALRNGRRFIKRGTRMARRGLRNLGRMTRRGLRRIGRATRRGVRRLGRGLNRMRRRVWNGAKRFGNRLVKNSTRTWNRMKANAKRGYATAKHIFSAMGKAASSTFSRMKTTASNAFSRIKSIASRAWSSLKSKAASTWSSIKSKASSMVSTVRSHVSSMLSAAKSKAASAWSTIRSGASSAVSTAKSLIASAVAAAVAAAHKIEAVLSHIHMPHFANGGPIQKSTMALVGEHGPETAYDPRTGRVRMLGMHGPQITALLAGEEVLTNTQTERLLHGGLGAGVRLPAYANGTGAEVDNSNSHNPTQDSAMSITGRFSGTDALKEMLDFGKKSKDIWGDISDNVVKSVTDARTNSGTEWQGLSKDVGDINTKLSKTTNDAFQDMSDKVLKLVNDLGNGLIDAAKGTATGFGDKFSDLIKYAKDDVKQVIDAINKGISGIDTALSSFGGNAHVIHQIHYATGTMGGRIAYPQFGILNDATSGPKQEAVIRGNHVFFPQGDNVHVPLERGDEVLNGEQTKELINNNTKVYHYASGSGVHLSKKLIKSMTGLLKTAVKNPTNTFKRFVGNDLHPSGHPFTQAVESMITKPIMKLGVPWTKAMFSYIKSLLTPPDSDSGGGDVNINASDANGSALLAEAEKLGAAAHNRYVWGANGPSAYDCGGLVLAALHHFGYTSDDRQTIIDHFPRESRSQALPGDLVENDEHEGIVADKGAHHYYSAFNPSMGIKMYPLDMTHWTSGDPTMRFARINLAPRSSSSDSSSSKKQSKTETFLQRLVKRELGASAAAWLKKAADTISFGGSTSQMSNPGGTNVSRFIPEIKAAASTMHATLTPTLLHLILGTVANESGGQTGASNDYDCNAGPNHSVGLLQYTLGTWNAYAMPGHTDRTNAYDNFLTFFNNSQYASSLVGYDSANGKSGGEWSPAHGSGPGGSRRFARVPAANGGWADQFNQRIFGEAGPEVAINPSRDTADHLIIQAIGARMQHSPNSPIAELVKSLGIKHKAHSMISGLKGLLTGSGEPKPKHNSQPIQIKLSIGNINIGGNPSHQQAHNLTSKLEKLIERGVQKAALRSKNRLSW